MADADFWRDLATKFRALPNDYGMFRIDWQRVEGEPTIWSAWGTSSVLAQFEALAVRAGAALNSESLDFRVTWLDALRNESPNSRKSASGIVQWPTGTQVRDTSGSISNVCEASADYCNALERLAFQTEFGKRAQEAHGICDQKTTELLPLRPHDPAWTATPLVAPKGKPQAMVENVPAQLKESLPITHLDEVPNQTAIPEEPNRKAIVDEFLKKCNEHSRTRILRRHIWLAVGHSKARQFEYWQASSPKATDQDERNFTRILAMDPEQFLGLLRQKRIVA